MSKVLYVDYINPSGLELDSKPYRIRNEGKYWNIRSYHRVEDYDDEDEGGKKVWTVDSEIFIERSAIRGIELFFDNQNGLYCLSLLIQGASDVSLHFQTRAEAIEPYKTIKSWLTLTL